MARVLVVDDDPDYVRITSRVLESAGYEVLSASNGVRALNSLRQNRPDLVLLDIMMSYILDGMDVSREMAKDPALKDIPVIMVTSMTGVRESSMFPTDEYSPADDWLSKPVDPDTLLSRVSEALGQP